MPGSYFEDVNFSLERGPSLVRLSPYQIQLNTVYRIASTLLENIFGIRYSVDRELSSKMPAMVANIDELLREWHAKLPADLVLNKDNDITPIDSTETKMHRLQALSLQLTYDNLMIVIHRPLLSDQKSMWLRSQSPGGGQGQAGSPLLSGVTSELAFERCLESALRVSKTRENHRNLFALARRTHLVSFVGMNLFTSSIVLFICALSDTLSDIAQEAKRGIARNLQTLRLLSGDGSLSMQCSTILEDLVQKIVDKEKEEMLRSLPTDDDAALFVPTRRSSLVHNTLLNVGGEMAGMYENSEPASEPRGSSAITSLPNGMTNGAAALQNTMASLQQGRVSFSWGDMNHS